MISNRPASQDHADNHFEEHLRRFRPVPPRRLAIPPRHAPWPRFAVAAGLLLGAAISFVAHRVEDAPVPHASAPPVTMGTLNAALRDNDEALNLLLDDASPNILPHSQRGTVLYELSKE